MNMITKLTFIIIIQVLILDDNVNAERDYKRDSRQDDDGYDELAQFLETHRSRDWSPWNPHNTRGRRYQYDPYLGVHRKFDRRRNSRKDRWRQNPQPSTKKHHIVKSEIMMPSGEIMNISLPNRSPYWNCGLKPELIYLSPKGDRSHIEYNIVKDEMERTWGDDFPYEIVKIHKVQNSCLWHRYLYRKEKILAETGFANERLLFYGSQEPSPYTLTYKGFDKRRTYMSRDWEAGIFFAESSFVSDEHTETEIHGFRKMLLCRVILGNMKTYDFPILLDYPPAGYHSVKVNNGEEVDYIVYRGEQVYPEFLITYI